MIDWTDTTLDWQVHTGGVCVLPIGSTEQHAAHLPLHTDNLEAEYFARMVAEDLDAALLPVLNFANCLEHSGFRGSVSLRPETLMQVLRDISEEMERQHFAVMVLLNGHGGNFSLLPAVRDINRRDRAIKILLVNFWEFCDASIARESASMGGEIHAGEWETSLMMALYPDLVRPEVSDMAPAGSDLPLQRSDLTTFGGGHFNARGALGFPSLASRDKGQRIVASIRERMLPFVRDRIARLRSNRRYAGGGGIAIRPLVEADLPAGMALKQAAGWNQTERDWSVLLRLGPQSCLAAVHNGRVVGTATGAVYAGRIAWIAMVLVEEGFRGMGIGTQLVEAVVDSVGGCETLGLDATPAGEGLYAKLGFRRQAGIQRLVAAAVGRADAGDGHSEPMTEAHVEEVAAQDSAAFGADRSVLIADLFDRGREWARVRTRGGRVTAWSLARPGANYVQLGPLVAETDEDAESLLGDVLGLARGRSTVVDVPAERSVVKPCLERAGFVVQRDFARMLLRGRAAPGGEGTYAFSGPEFG